MATIIKKIHLVKSDPVNNNNKFWRGTLFSNDDVLCEWGRVGDKGQSKLFSGVGSSFLDKKANEKKRDGRNGEIAYREVEIIDSDVVPSKASTVQVKDASLSKIAKEQIKTTSTEASKLIDYFTKINIHNITNFSSQIKYNYDSGKFQTPMGYVMQSGIDRARNILNEIGDLVVAKKYNQRLMDLTRDLLMEIPQDIGRNRLELPVFWASIDDVRKQNSVLDGLEASLLDMLKPSNSSDSKVNTPKVFNTSLEDVKDKKVEREIFDYYYKTRSTMHNCYHYSPIKLWRVSIDDMKNAFESDGAKMKNRAFGFHGSSSENMLSLLKSGILARPPASAAVSGKVFGHGAYMAPVRRSNGDLIKGAATKALGYAVGNWSGRAYDRTFMFFVEAGMGNFYIPNARTYQSISYPVKGYDSTWAYGGISGVRNDEAIVYRSSQMNILYLIELKK